MTKGDVLRFHCADDAKSSQEVIKKIKEIEKKGIILRSTIEKGNTVLTTKSDNYRWIDPEYFAASEVMAIYGDRVVINTYNADVQGGDEDMFLIIFSQSLATAMIRQFDYWWNKGEQPCLT